jgi:hypothetical protein
MLGNQLRLECALAVAGNIQWQFTKIALQGLGTVTVAGVAGAVANSAAPTVAEVFGHLGFECTLNQHLGKLLEQAVLANQVFGFLIVGQKRIGQF